MTQPTQADQGTLRFVLDGTPALGYYVGAPNTTGSLKFVLDGIPVYAPGAAAGSDAARPYVFFMT